jgi:hypothetical protein
MFTRSLVATTLAVALMAIPARAQADTFLTPYIGSTFAAKLGPTEPGSKFVYGADLMWLGTSGLGFELDLAYHPKFFSADDDETIFDLDSDGNVVTMMGNMVFGYKGGGIQPYVTGGAGLMRVAVSSPTDLFTDLSDSAFGVNAGGGLRVGSGRFGVRGDLRYFRQLQSVEFEDPDVDLGDFSYWRGTVGLSIGF